MGQKGNETRAMSRISIVFVHSFMATVYHTNTSTIPRQNADTVIKTISVL